MKIGLSSVRKIYLVYEILENAKTCLYSNKAADVFETNPITAIFCYCPEMKTNGTLNKHPGSSSVIKWHTNSHEKGSETANSEGFLKLWSK